MKKIILAVLLTISAQACLPPMQPLPPIGCSSDNAVLINHGGECYWVFMGC